MTQRVPRIAWAALALSAVLHGALLLWLWLLPPPPPRTEPPTPAELRLVEFEPPPPAPPPAPPPSPPTAPPRTPRLPPVLAQPAPTDDPPTPPPLDDAPRLDPPPLALTLAPGSSFAVKVEAAKEPQPLDAPTGLHGLDRPKDLVAELAHETIGRGKVDRGLVHPYYAQLGKALVKVWNADRAMSKGGLKGYAEQFSANSKIFNEIWLDRAAQYGRTGSPLSGPLSTNRTAPVNDRIQGSQGQDLAARKELGREMRNAYRATRRATLRVVQLSSGKLERVELLEPSNDSNVDREALADVRAAAEQLPPPPPEVLGNRTSVSSLWSFELIISISPPIPTFTFEFDEALGFIDARLPLDRRIYKKVRLVAVE